MNQPLSIKDLDEAVSLLDLARNALRELTPRNTSSALVDTIDEFLSGTMATEEELQEDLL